MNKHKSTTFFFVGLSVGLVAILAVLAMQRQKIATHNTGGTQVREGVVANTNEQASAIDAATRDEEFLEDDGEAGSGELSANTYNQGSKTTTVPSESGPLTITVDYPGGPFFIQDIPYGTTGNSDLKLIQTFLINDGFLHGTPNGSIWDVTSDAVRSYQSTLGIKKTGFIDSATRQALNIQMNESPEKFQYVFHVPNKPETPDVAGPRGHAFVDQFYTNTQSCDGLNIISPVPHQEVAFPIIVVAEHQWGGFEGEGGTVIIQDINGHPVGDVGIFPADQGPGSRPIRETFQSIKRKPDTTVLNIVFRNNNPAAPHEGTTRRCALSVRLDQDQYNNIVCAPGGCHIES